MKILLLSVNSRTFFYSQVVIPFGLASLGSYVQNDGHTIKGIEMNTPLEKIPERYLCVDKELLEKITRFKPDLVAMSTYAENIHNVLFWSKIIKKALPETTIALGGNHASYIAREILEKVPAVDVVVRFEGEIPFKQLCDQIERDERNYDDIPNIVYRKNGTIRENPLVGLIEDLDTLPILNRDFFKYAEYSELSHADIITARGCPFHCTFCNCNHYWQKRYRTMSVQRVIKELRLLKKRYPELLTVRIRDETISINKKRCIELCEALIKENFGLKFQAHSRLDGLDEEVIKHLSLAGFNQLFIGVESGSPTVLERLKKGIKVERLPEIIALLRKYHISFRLSLMLATPGETLDESLETIKLVNELDLDFHEFYFGRGIIIYPGTSDCQDFLEKFPDYQWLGRQQLENGYTENVDQKGKAVSIVYLAPQYSLDTLDNQINTTLKAKLQKYDETKYRVLASTLSYAVSVKNRFTTPQIFDERITTFLKAVDSTGKKWAIYRKGALYSELFADAVQENTFEHFARILTSQDTKRLKKAELKKQFQEVDYVLLVSLKRKAYKRETIYDIWDIFGFAVKIFVIDELFHKDALNNFSYQKSIHEILQSARIEVYYPKFHVIKTFRRFKLDGIARKIARLNRLFPKSATKAIEKALGD